MTHYFIPLTSRNNFAIKYRQASLPAQIWPKSMSTWTSPTLKRCITLLVVALLCCTASNSVFLASRLRLIRAHISRFNQENLQDNAASASTPSMAASLTAMVSSDTPLLKAAAAYIVRKETHAHCDIEKVGNDASWDKTDGRRRDIGICLQIRNDAGILDEYIAFHWLQVRKVSFTLIDTPFHHQEVTMYLITDPNII
jgi:hypothetical protein